jgi:hypothetical protein
MPVYYFGMPEGQVNTRNPIAPAHETSEKQERSGGGTPNLMEKDMRHFEMVLLTLACGELGCSSAQ